MSKDCMDKYAEEMKNVKPPVMSKDNREELKSCPFCGDKVRYRKSDGKGVCKTTHYINCDNCGLEMFDITEKGLIDNWNWRNGEVTIDSGAEVCEWVEGDCLYETKCNEVSYNYDRSWEFCPYCGKKITIKGE